MQPWMRVSSGRYLDLAQFDVSDVDLIDVMTALNEIKRCNGHGARRSPLTVLQHSLLVCDILYEWTGCKDTALAGLLHDAHEAYIGDTTSPVKTLTGFIEPEEIIVAVRQAMHWNYPADYAPIRRADLAALEIERKAQWVYHPNDEMYWPEQVLFISEDSALARFDDYQSYGIEAFGDAYRYHGGTL